MLHRHFEIDVDERVVEFRGVATPWPIDSEEVFGGKVVPRCWGFFSDGELHPTEFSFVLPSESTVPDPNFRLAFVEEFYDLLTKWNLERHLGLTLLDPAEYLTTRRVERTIGRVSITLPAADGQLGKDGATIAETAWTFGCQQSMDDSALGGRICWVCQQCPPKPK